MAIQTGGFTVARGGGAQFQPATPTPLSFVSGASLAPGDLGINAITEGSRQATASLLSGVNVALESVLGAGIGLLERKQKREEDELAHQRALEIARERNVLGNILSPLDRERLLGQRLQNIEQIRKLEDPYAEFLGEKGPSPLGDIPDPNLGLRPEDLPLEPFDPNAPENVEPGLPSGDVPLPPLQGARPPGEEPAPGAAPEGYTTAGPGGMLLVVPIPEESGGGRMIINRATGATTIDKGAGGRTETTASGLPEELKDELRLKGVTVNAKGEVSTTYEPSTADADQEKEISTMQSSIEQANRVVRDIDTIVDTAQGARLPATGKFSDWIATLPVTTGASDVRALIKNIEADVAFKTLADMRRNSKTGGALGAISDRELALLAAAEGSINPSLSWPIFKRNLQDISKARKELIKMWGGKLASMGAGTSQFDLTAEINSLAEQLDDMPDRNSEEYRAGRERLKELVRRQRGQ
jgi:hypothetical protein